MHMQVYCMSNEATMDLIDVGRVRFAEESRTITLDCNDKPIKGCRIHNLLCSRLRALGSEYNHQAWWILSAS
jgi:hypothetical protein